LRIQAIHCQESDTTSEPRAVAIGSYLQPAFNISVGRKNQEVECLDPVATARGSDVVSLSWQ
jgi:hypothetical protein